MAQALRLLAAIAIVTGCAGCGGTDDELRQHRQKLESLAATTSFIEQSYDAGVISSTFARTALDQSLRLVEQERSAIGEDPHLLADPRGAQLSQQGEHLSRQIAQFAKRIEDRP